MTLTLDDVKKAADELFTEGGESAVSLRKVRTRLGRGSLQTIHRFLAVWRVERQLSGPAAAAATLDVPVRFLPSIDYDTSHAAQILTPHVTTFDDIDIRTGVPEGLLHVRHPDAESVCFLADILHAKALVKLTRQEVRQGGAKRGHWSRVYSGIVIPAFAVEAVLAACDWYGAQRDAGLQPDGKGLKAFVAGLRRERAQVTVQFDRTVYDALERKATARRQTLAGYIAELLLAASRD